MRTGDYMPRAGGTFWATQGVFREEPGDREEVHPRHRQGRDVLPRQQGGLDRRRMQGAPRHRRATRRPASSGTRLHNTFGAEMPKGLFREIFESRRLDMIAAKQWPEDKPLPDPEQFLARRLLETTLKGNEIRPDQARRAEELTTSAWFSGE